MPDGSTWTFSAAEVVDTRSPRLDYSYQDTSDPFGGADFRAERLARVGVRVSAAPRSNAESAMAQPRSELVGANDETVRLESAAVETRLRVDPEAARTTMRSPGVQGEAAAADVEPDRVFLNLENVHGVNDAAVIYVYISHPAASLAEELVGAVSLFGARKASALDSPRGGNGINESLEITEWVDRLRAAGVQDLDDLKVRLVPRTQIRPEDDISIGRISVYRQGR
jgi:tyrosinase